MEEWRKKIIIGFFCLMLLAVSLETFITSHGLGGIDILLGIVGCVYFLFVIGFMKCFYGDSR